MSGLEIIMFGIKKILIILMFLSFTCSYGEAKAKHRLKFATMAPKAIGWSMHIRNTFMPAFEKITEGNVSIKWYWGGLKGDDIDYIRLMKEGRLDGAAFSGHGVTLICPEMSALSLPFLFQNFDEVDYVRKHMTTRFNQLADKHGYRFLYWGDQDFNQIYTIKQPIQKIDDFKNIMITGWYNTPIDLLLVEKLRTKHMPVRTLEINSVLRQRKADAYIGPALWVVGCQLYTLFQYITHLNMRYSPAALVITKKAWNKIPQKYHSRILKMLNEKGQVFCKKARVDTKRSLMAMKKYGLKTMTISPTEKKAMTKRCKPIWAETVNKAFPESILKEIQMHLHHYRNQ
jgi:TRAP-type C4-dicarboxylate transport system substrate-binding protein